MIETFKFFGGLWKTHKRAQRRRRFQIATEILNNRFDTYPR